MKKVLTVGVYDLLHIGHIELFRRARDLGDFLIVAVQRSDVVLKYKPNAEIVYGTEERMYMVQSIRYVDQVIEYSDVDEIVKKVDFDVFVTGPDQNHAGFQTAIKWCQQNGKEHVILSRTEGISSSLLKRSIAEQNQKK
jgi:cytidyltransferase-like protein